MMHYKKGKNVEEELSKEQIPIEVLPEHFLWMHVKGGSRIFNLVEYAKKALDAGEYRSLVWSGSDGGVGKTISCAEIMKKDYQLHQVTRICYRKVEEYWDAQQEGLEQIVATRKIPSIHILMSLDEIDSSTPGYQHSKTRTTFWLEGKANRKPSGDGVGTRKNYFTGPQLKKKPNRNYGDKPDKVKEGDGAGQMNAKKKKPRNNDRSGGGPPQDKRDGGSRGKQSKPRDSGEPSAGTPMET
ncbi:ribonuclease P protein subunit p25-like protein [Uranotaenia lowii]|uniref:ribonuclease P protein subunit p25-like protein n=1 Tax=Uranotaenia lowii TaxID=190385 RepID=UPI00247A6250|nr:ribonuclease P protein subunit p25-like protein [Uranotaenia lowii]XP_055608429.1 ribonuclease P protein subunit p25-like protein [Uranotaenia lowii]XP_055608430.1 ribonuclease P protein subunit p25-like protein [Uranotaenia lowii]XP_055608431.1 ribonuclease P protein subunit p25-like protein [Uranotaenia lowii]XP_055608432.1 ribonuclease P protein subunit p25-like protein [Uranotaenia lowii]XP_055608433.1 ribonuclease P protein subunit p25-like protein [Uranotaenia lowii]XP_055608434.1 ri